jgi:hypothetical protein
MTPGRLFSGKVAFRLTGVTMFDESSISSGTASFLVARIKALLVVVSVLLGSDSLVSRQLYFLVEPHKATMKFTVIPSQIMIDIAS